MLAQLTIDRMTEGYEQVESQFVSFCRENKMNPYNGNPWRNWTLAWEYARIGIFTPEEAFAKFHPMTMKACEQYNLDFKSGELWEKHLAAWKLALEDKMAA